MSRRYNKNRGKKRFKGSKKSFKRRRPSKGFLIQRGGSNIS